MCRRRRRAVALEPVEPLPEGVKLEIDGEADDFEASVWSPGRYSRGQRLSVACGRTPERAAEAAVRSYWADVRRERALEEGIARAKAMFTTEEVS